MMTPQAPTLRSEQPHAWLNWILPVAAFAGAAWLSHAGRLRLSFDGYYYVELAKLFRHTPPESFGNAWPFGWPLMGAAIGIFGASAYQGLLVCAVASWVGLLVLMARLWPWADTGRPAGMLALCALGTLYPVSALVIGVFSEVPFALAMLVFACGLAAWPRPSAILLACVAALFAFVIRYAGALLLLLAGMWLLMPPERGLKGRQPRLAWIAVALVAGISLALLAWNKSATGHWSGYPRGGAAPMAQWPEIAADLGWSMPSLLGGLGLRDVLGFGTKLRVPLGLFMLGCLLWLAAKAFVSAGGLRRVLGATILVYAAGMVLLRWAGEFDALHSARTALPLAAPAALLLAHLLPKGWPTIAALVALLGLNLGLASRGASLEVAADVRPALPWTRNLRTGAIVSVNDPARTLAAHLDCAVQRLPAPAGVDPARCGDVVVLAPSPVNREGLAGALDPRWNLAANGLRERGYTMVLETPSLLVLVRNVTG